MRRRQSNARAGGVSGRSRVLPECLLHEGSTGSFSRAVASPSQIEQANEDISENLLPASCNVHQGTLARHYMMTVAIITAAVRSDASSQPDSRIPASYLCPCNSSSHCYRCGSCQHRTASSHCPAKGQRCYHYNLTGHFSSVCNKKRQGGAVRELSRQNLPD